ncbi:hypothetical protein EDC04DRAFT_2609314 [Pisolithus marmoratus]|nr:hypothetical protein EDC04DRAFT_2609314 [Pisolithus marmoratus]
MSQNIANTGLPTPAATQDWSATPDEALQLASEDKQEIANAKQSKMLVETRPRMSALIGNGPGTSVLVLVESSKVKGKAKACDLVPVGPCAQCVRAGVECMFKLAKCLGLKEQCMLPGAEKKKKRGPEEMTSPRAGDKKKRVSENLAGEILVVRGLHAIVAAIDQHTNKMVKHREIAKETQHVQRWFNDHLYELLQEMEYWQVAEVEESSDEESTSEEMSDRETNEDAEGEEAPESDLEVSTMRRRPKAGNKWERIHEVVMSGVLVLDETYWNIEGVYQYS